MKTGAKSFVYNDLREDKTFLTLVSQLSTFGNRRSEGGSQKSEGGIRRTGCCRTHEIREYLKNIHLSVSQTVIFGDY